MNYVYFIENNQYVKVNTRTYAIKLKRDYPYIYIPKATDEFMEFARKLWKYRKDIECALWFGGGIKNNKRGDYNVKRKTN